MKDVANGGQQEPHPTSGIDEVVISEAVVERIVRDAVVGLDGVHSIADPAVPPPMSGLAQDIYRMMRSSAGVRASINDQSVTIRLSLRLLQDAEIREVSKRVRDTVRAAVSSGTGLKVQKVSVRVVDLQPASAESPEAD